MNAQPLPSSVGALTASWITTVLHAAGVLDAQRVTSIDTEVIGQDFGFTGVIARLRLTYDTDSGTAPRSLIAKLPTADRDATSSYRERQGSDLAARRRMAERAARELWFYKQIAVHGQVPAPGLYAGAADLDRGQGVLLLEDVAPAVQGDVLAGCSAEQPAVVVQTMARFHAAWWQHPALDTLAWLPDGSADADARQARYRATADRFLDRYGAQVDRRICALVEQLRTRYARLLQILATPPCTLIHGDLHLDNILFHPGSHEHPITILDWQSIARGRGVVDLALFLADSLTSETRRACETELLDDYHALLVAHGVEDYSHDDLLRDYRRALMRQLAGVVGWLGAVDVAALAGRERVLVEETLHEGRLFAAVLDHDVEQVALI